MHLLGTLLCEGEEQPAGFRVGQRATDQLVEEAAVALDQFVLQAHEDLAAARIALARAAAEKLTIDAPGLVHLGHDHVQAAGRERFRRQLDVGAAARHVGRHGDASGLSGDRDDVGLLLVLARIEHPIFQPRCRQERRDPLRRFHGAGADQHRATLVVLASDRLDRGGILRLQRRIQHGRRDPAQHRFARRHARHLEAIHRPQFRGDLLRGAGHARKPQVAAEEALVRDACQRLALTGKRTALLHLDQLMQAALPRTIGHGAAGVLVDDHDLALFHQVVLVALELMQRRERLLHQLLAPVGTGPEAAHAGGELLQPLLAGIGDADAGLVMLEDEILTLLELPREIQRFAVQTLQAGIAGIAGDDERRARLVHQDAVHLVDDGEGQSAQREVAVAAAAGHLVDRIAQRARTALQFHAVAQVVEGDVLVGAVRDVVAVLRRAIGQRHVLGHAAHGKTERAIQRTHLFGIARREVVVDRDHVRGPSTERRGRGGQRGGERLPFAGLHLGDAARQQDPAARELHVVVAYAERVPGRRADQREGAGHQRIGEPVALQLRPQLHGSRPQFLQRQRIELRTGRIHRRDEGIEAALAHRMHTLQPQRGAARGALQPSLPRLQLLGIEAVPENLRSDARH